MHLLLIDLIDDVPDCLIRSACLLSLGLQSEPLTAEARQVGDKVSTDVILFQRSVNEVAHQQTLKEELFKKSWISPIFKSKEIMTLYNSFSL